MYAMKYPYLVNLSIMTSIVLYTCSITRSFDFSNFTIKSYNITSYSLLSVSISCSSLYSLCLLNLFLQQSRHSFMTSFTKFYTFLIIYSFYSLNTKAITLLCPCISPLQNSITNYFIMSFRIYIASSYISCPLQFLQSGSISLASLILCS